MNRNISLLLVAVIVVGASGALISQKFADNEPPVGLAPTVQTNNDPGAADVEQIADVLESLTKALNEEISERRLLSEQVAQLREDVAELQTEQRRRAERDPPPTVIDMQERDMRFAEMGFTEQDKEAIFAMVRESQFSQVELDDRARREGWINTRRYVEESQALFTYDSPIRAELGDERYDRYLYAMGRPNRLVVGSLMASSPAQKAGLIRGDVIVRYGGEPVFSNLHMVNLRSSGKQGEPVVVEIVRNGQPMLITMPRGPMGFGGHDENIDPRTNTWRGSE